MIESACIGGVVIYEIRNTRVCGQVVGMDGSGVYAKIVMSESLDLAIKRFEELVRKIRTTPGLVRLTTITAEEYLLGKNIEIVTC